MSADAKAWQDDDGEWYAIHDGECKLNAETRHRAIRYGLRELLTEVSECMDCEHMRWELYVYPDGKAGLRGFTW